MTPRELAAAENADQLRYCYRDRASGFQGRWGRAVEQAERHIAKLEAIRDGLRSLELIEDLRQELEETQADLDSVTASNEALNEMVQGRWDAAWKDGYEHAVKEAKSSHSAAAPRKTKRTRRVEAQASLFDDVA